jgi:hypothetical protein
MVLIMIGIICIKYGVFRYCHIVIPNYIPVNIDPKNRAEEAK